MMKMPVSTKEISLKPIPRDTFLKLRDSILTSPLVAVVSAMDKESAHRVGEEMGGMTVAHVIASTPQGARKILKQRSDLHGLQSDNGTTVEQIAKSTLRRDMALSVHA
jgi:hypothetical protein